MLIFRKTEALTKVTSWRNTVGVYTMPGTTVITAREENFISLLHNHFYGGNSACLFWNELKGIWPNSLFMVVWIFQQSLYRNENANSHYLTIGDFAHVWCQRIQPQQRNQDNLVILRKSCQCHVNTVEHTEKQCLPPFWIRLMEHTRGWEGWAQSAILVCQTTRPNSVQQRLVCTYLNCFSVWPTITNKVD